MKVRQVIQLEREKRVMAKEMSKEFLKYMKRDTL